jgi:hypothetical protein
MSLKYIPTQPSFKVVCFPCRTEWYPARLSRSDRHCSRCGAATFMSIVNLAQIDLFGQEAAVAGRINADQRERPMAG